FTTAASLNCLNTTLSADAAQSLATHEPSQSDARSIVPDAPMSPPWSFANIVPSCFQPFGAASVNVSFDLPRSSTTSVLSNASLSLSSAGTSAFTTAASIVNVGDDAGGADSFAMLESDDLPHADSARTTARSLLIVGHPRSG